MCWHQRLARAGVITVGVAALILAPHLIHAGITHHNHLIVAGATLTLAAMTGFITHRLIADHNNL